MLKPNTWAITTRGYDKTCQSELQQLCLALSCTATEHTEGHTMNLSQLLTRGKEPVVLTYNRTFTNTAAPLRTPAGESSQSPQQPVPKASSNKKTCQFF